MQTTVPTGKKKPDYLFAGAVVLLLLIIAGIAAYFLLQPSPPQTIPYPAGYVAGEAAKVKPANKLEQQALGIAQQVYGGSIVFIQLDDQGVLQIWYDGVGGVGDKALLLKASTDFEKVAPLLFSASNSFKRLEVSEYVNFADPKVSQSGNPAIHDGVAIEFDMNREKAYQIKPGMRLVELSLACDTILPHTVLVKAWAEMIGAS